MMEKNIKTINFGYETKLFQKSSVFFSYFIKTPCSTIIQYTHFSLFSKDIIQQKQSNVLFKFKW